MWTPLGSALGTIAQLPPLANVVPKRVVPSKSATVVPASAVPVIVGVTTFVMLSTLDDPLSEAAAKSGFDGATGEVRSMVTPSAADSALVLPAASLARAAIVCTPSANAGDVMVQFPEASAMAVP